MKPSESRGDLTADRDTDDEATQPKPKAPALSEAIARPQEPSADSARAQLLDALGTEASGHIGGYRLVERIGEGAMGHVYRAQHVLLERFVAIKMLLPELATDAAATARFFAEARLLNRIEHPHVIDVTDFARDANGTPWFVMELLEGSDLADLLEHGPIGLRRSLEIVRQLCEALAAVHAAGIVHRDVKPQNTFVSTRDGKDFAKLIDFGVARLPDPAHADPIVAKEGIVGTLPYMAPEQVLAGRIDFRSDLYALGGVLFELVAGRTPFQRDDMHVLMDDVLNAAPPVPSELVYVPAAIRRDLDGLIASCLAKEPAKRPQSARAIADALADLTRRLDSPVRPQPQPVLSPTTKIQPRWLAGLVTGILLWLITASAGEPADVYVASPAAAAPVTAEPAPSPPPVVPSGISDLDRDPQKPPINKRSRRSKKSRAPDRDLVLDPFP
jgi:serine/threonine protein kinase